MGAGQLKTDLAQWTRRSWGPASLLALALGNAAPAQAADGYVGDFSFSTPAPDYVNSGATVWSGAQSHSQIANPAGASILNEGTATGDIVANGGVIRNAPAATWNGNLDLGANTAGAQVVNEGKWSGTLNNAGGGLDNSGTASAVNNAAGVFANEGTISGDVANGGQAANSGIIAGRVNN